MRAIYKLVAIVMAINLFYLFICLTENYSTVTMAEIEYCNDTSYIPATSSGYTLKKRNLVNHIKCILDSLSCYTTDKIIDTSLPLIEKPVMRSHIVYCGKKMVYAICSQFHPPHKLSC